MDLIIEYLIAKGGMFGILLAIAFAWIVFREQALFRQNQKDKTVGKEPKQEVDKILYIVEDLKAVQEKAFIQISNIGPTIDKLLVLEQVELDNIQKLVKQIGLIDGKIFDIERKTNDLHDWHAVKDSEGVPVWYVRKSLEDSIVKLEYSIVSLENNFTQITDTIRGEIDDRVRKVNKDRITELKKLLKAYNKTVTDLILALEKIKFILRSEDKG